MMTKMTPFKLLVTGGGTGGHLFPAIAVAEAIRGDLPDSQVLFVGTRRKMDTTTLGRRNFATSAIRCEGLKGKGLWAIVRTIFLLPLSLLDSGRVIRKFRPDLVFGVGGYVTGPVVLAARLLKVPTCIHEQNSVPGLANRLLGRIAKKIFISLPESARFFPADRTVLTGNPVRQELLAMAREIPKNDKNDPVLLILGGSQGAHRLNTLVLEALQTHAAALPPGLQIIHQTGEQDENMVRDTYSKLALPARVSAFFQDMAAIYREADLLVSRAGATTLAEIMVLKKPALLIPFPFAADNHQEKNGNYLVRSKAARMFLQQELNGDILGREIVSLLADPVTRLAMADNLGRLARPDATNTIVRECLKLVADRRPDKPAGTGKTF